MKTLTVLEHERLPIGGAAEKKLSPKQARLLEKLEPGFPGQGLLWGNGHVSFRQFCGVVGLGDVQVEILPKITGQESQPGVCRNVLIAMLEKVGRLHTNLGETQMDLQNHHFLDVVIRHFCELLLRETQRGFIQDYVEHEVALPVLRGRLVIHKQLRQGHGSVGRLECQFQEFEIDNPYNQVIKGTLRLLWPLAHNPDTRKKLDRLLFLYHDVSDRAVTADQASALKMDRTKKRYAPILNLCRWFLASSSPDVTAGDQRLFCMVFDMNRLFEEFITHAFRKLAVRFGLSLRAQGPQHTLVSVYDTGLELLKMQPDITLLHETDPVMILDCKWKLLDARKKRLGVSREDLYQAHAYAVGYNCRDLVLIYPHQAKIADKVKVMKLGSDMLHILLLDLGQLLSGRKAFEQYLLEAVNLIFLAMRGRDSSKDNNHLVFK